MGIKPLSKIKPIPEYEKFEYDREYVTKSEVSDIIKEALGLDASKVSKIVYDGKITPVVIINKMYEDRVYMTAPQAVVFNAGIAEKIVFDTLDIGENYDFVNNVYIAPVKGCYLFQLAVTYQPSDGNSDIVISITDGSGFRGYEQYLKGGSNTLSLSGIFNLEKLGEVTPWVTAFTNNIDLVGLTTSLYVKRLL